MSAVKQNGNEYHLSTFTSLADRQASVLKHDDAFAIFNLHGDIQYPSSESFGLFDKGTRHLNRWALELSRRPLLLLSSTVQKGNEALLVDLTNPDFESEKDIWTPRAFVHINRWMFLWRGSLYERIVLVNYASHVVHATLHIGFDADFVDIFEIRGAERPARGRMLPPEIQDQGVILAYEGLDKIVRRTRVHSSIHPDYLSANEIGFDLALAPHEEQEYSLSVECQSNGGSYQLKSCQAAWLGWRNEQAALQANSCDVETSNEQFNEWIKQSKADLFMMLTLTPYGYYPYAGIPWFNTVFGRDGIISALESLWAFPEIGRSVLRYLAAHQATVLNLQREAEPGKILHEQRYGEMANLGEIPFGQYYGTIDATPLFVVLAGKYFANTHDVEFIRAIWPNVCAALNWTEEYGDVDGDGFVEYARHGPTGLIHQGWKDSNDSIFHANGADPDPPIALCEVQGYVYDAYENAATMARALGEEDTARRWRNRSSDLRDRFHEHFWQPEIGMYALALDGKKQPCAVRSSNAGHCLYSGIADADHALTMAPALMSPNFFSGWGVRTIPKGEARYNPMSYHNGSIWPHDNALIGAGLARYGFKQSCVEILTSLFDASMFIERNRLPELYCGFERQAGVGPTLYPVACDPQAWASASVFLLLQSCLGLSVDAKERQLRFHKPMLPPFLEWIRILNVPAAGARVDVELKREAKDIQVAFQKNIANIELVVTK